MISSSLNSETNRARGEAWKTMEGSEERTSLEASPSALGEITDDESDFSMEPLLSPHPSLINHPETSTARARSPELEQGVQDDAQELRQFRATSYMASVVDAVLRSVAVTLSLIALVFTAVKWKGHYWERSQNEFMNFFLSGYMLSVNVVVFLYSCATLSLTIFQSVNRHSRGSNNLLFLLSVFQLDQTFAYLLISATLNAFDSSGTITTSSPPTKLEFFYERTLACAVVSLLAIAALATTFLSSGYRLFAKLCKYSQNALEIPLHDDCDSPTSKLLP